VTAPGKGLAAPSRRDVTAELLISKLLRYGVVASVSVILIGMAVTFARHPEYSSSVADTARLTSTNDAPHRLADVWLGMRALRGRAVVMAGLLLLIGVPVARVFLSLFIFGYRRDRVFMAITSVVSALLMASFLLGRVTE